MTLYEALDEIRAGELPPYEIIAQAWDVLVQAIEFEHQAVTGQLPVSRRTSKLQVWVSERNVELAQLLGEVRKRGKKAVSELNPEAQTADLFVQDVVGWLAKTGWALPNYEKRIQYSPKEINQTGFEWGDRYRSFKVIHGSVVRSNADVLVTSAEIDAEGNWHSGQALSALEARIKLGGVERHLFLGDGLEVHVRLVCGQNQTVPFDRVLVLGVPTNWGVLDEQEYKRLRRAILSALRAEETWIEGLKSVACSLIGGNRLPGHLDAWVAKELIELGRRWMKTSESGESFQVILFKESEAMDFSNAMDQVLGRGVERIVEHPVAEPLRLKVREALGQLPHQLREAANPLDDALSDADGLTVERICAFSRAWVEQLAHQLLVSEGISVTRELMKNIQKLEECKHISPWILSYMHTCRIMGNKAVHARHKKPQYHDCLHGSDLVVVLSAVLALSKFSTHRDWN